MVRLHEACGVQKCDGCEATRPRHHRNLWALPEIVRMSSRAMAVPGEGGIRCCYTGSLCTTMAYTCRCSAIML